VVDHVFKLLPRFELKVLGQGVDHKFEKSIGRLAIFEHMSEDDMNDVAGRYSWLVSALPRLTAKVKKL
jgi:hypothetical protein